MTAIEVSMAEATTDDVSLSPEEALQQRAQTVLAAFEGGITPSRVPFLYQAGLFVIALTMVLLPVIYLGLIVLVGYGVYWHTVNDTWLLTAGHFNNGRVMALRLLVYVCPIVAGAIIVFFLLKPFLAREGHHNQSFTIAASSEPLLFAFIQQVCALVGAPMPKRVQVNCEVNASASFRRGAWSMLSNDLTLTIGLPLVQGLTVREFAGVLAHEFGHFAQGAGMRICYIIGGINRWFYRVVNERDEWDEWLVEQSEDPDSRWGALLWFGRLGVWISRGVLRVLMFFGHAISCFMSRQMEFDADTYETKLAGSDAFAATMQKIQVLGFASAQSDSDLSTSAKTGRWPDNLPKYIVHKVSVIPEEVKDQIRAEATKEKTSLFRTHPADADRVQKAMAANAPGVFRLEEPASILFKDFAELCKSSTLYHYQQDLELELTPNNLVATEETMTESNADVEGATAAMRYFFQGVTNLRPILLSAQDIRPLDDPNQSLDNLIQARQRMEAASPQVKGPLGAWLDAERKGVLAYQAGQLLLVGIQITPHAFQLSAGTSQAAKESEAAATQLLKQSAPELDAFENDARARLASALQLLQVSEVLASFENGEALQREVFDLIRLMDVLRSVIPELLEIRKEHGALELLVANREHYSEVERVDYRISKVAGAIAKLIPDVQLKLARVPFPFKHAKGDLNVADYARYEPADTHPVLSALQQGSSHLERLPALYSRILGRLVLIAEQVEARVVPPASETPAT